MKRSVKEWGLRIAILMGGLTVAHLDVTLFLLSDLGSDPFNVLVQGLFRSLTEKAGLPFLSHGGIHVALSLLIVAVLLFTDRSYVKIGTALCMLFGGPIIDLFTLLLQPLFAGAGLPLRLLLTTAGCVILAYGMTIVICSDAGTGPNDLVALVISEKAGFRFSLTRIAVDALFALGGWLLGGTAGLRELLGEIPYPLKVDNDASASGHGECFARRSRESMAYLSLENGVGGAVILGGAPYAGKHSRSGEFGHICVEPGGLRCACGKLGCLEAYCSQKRFERSFGVSIEDFFRGVSEHRPEYEDLLYDALRHMAVGINSIRKTLDCDVILGGSLSEYLLPYLPAIRRYVLAGNPFEENADFVQFSLLRHHITPLGASLYFIRDFVERV